MLNFLKFSSILIFLVFFSCKESKKKGENEEEKSMVASFVPNDTSALYTWSALGCCESAGIYNPKLISEKNLKSIFELVTGESSRLQTQTIPWSIEDISKLDLEKLTKEFEEKISRLKKMRIEGSEFFEELRNLRIRELEEEYELGRIDILAYSDSTVLLDNRFSKLCFEYVNALTSSDSLLFITWRKYAEEHKHESGSPESYMKTFEERFNSPDRLIYGKMELLTSGFHNCANHSNFHYNNDGKSVAEFEKLFRIVENDCSGCD